MVFGQESPSFSVDSLITTDMGYGSIVVHGYSISPGLLKEMVTFNFIEVFSCAYSELLFFLLWLSLK